MRYFVVKGNHYECGQQIGRAMKKEIASRLKLMRISREKVRRNWTKLQFINQLCFLKYPEYVRELKGYSDGSGADYWQLLMLNSPIFGTNHGCSSIAVNEKNQTLLAHNEDGANFESKNNCALIKFIQRDAVFHSFVYAGELAGNAYNWNSERLFFTVNSIPTLKVDVSVPRYFTARALCETGNLLRAVRILKQSDDASGFHYFIGKGNRIVSVEHFQDKIGVHEVKEKYAHTNHFILKKFAKFSREYPDTASRLERIRKMLPDHELLEIINDRQNKMYPLLRKGERGYRTLSQVIFNPREKKVWIYDGKLWKVLEL